MVVQDLGRVQPQQALHQAQQMRPPWGLMALVVQSQQQRTSLASQWAQRPPKRLSAIKMWPQGHPP